MITEKTVQELKRWTDENIDFQLIDVREPNEYEIAQIGGELIPLHTIPQNTDKINKNKPVIVHCRSGARSGKAVEYLLSQGFENIYNLKGGILAWADEIDPSITKY